MAVSSFTNRVAGLEVGWTWRPVWKWGRD